MATQHVPNGWIVYLIKRSQPCGSLNIASPKPSELSSWWLHGAGIRPVSAPHEAFSNGWKESVARFLEFQQSCLISY